MIKFSVRDVNSKGLEINQTIPKEGIGLSSEEIDLRSPITVNWANNANEVYENGN